MLLAAPPGVAQDPAPPILVPGPGFSGDTPQPDPVGTGFGADAKAIARWDVVPYQTFDCAFEIGVVAFHINGIDRVEFSLNGGPWAPVTEMTRNPRTNVVEYWAQLDCQGLPDGPVEIRAIAYPTVGIPRVLGGAMNGPGFSKGEHSLFLNSNGNGTLPVISRYVSPTGDDATGDGSVGKPFRTIMKAARAIQVASGTGNADGGRILLAAGDHILGTYDYSMITVTVQRWLTIQPMENLPKGSVRIVQTGKDGLRTKLVHLKNLRLEPAPGADQALVKSNGPLEDYAWTEACDFIGPGRSVDGMWIRSFSDVYITDCRVAHCRDAPTGALVRNVTIDDIGSDALTGAGLAVSCNISDIDASGTSFHADVFQFYTPTATIENRIAYDIVARSRSGQGFFAGDGVSLKDIAFIDCDIDNQLNNTVAAVFQFCGPTEHMFIRNCRFNGPAYWRVDMQFTAKNIVVEKSNFHGPPDSRPSPGVLEGVLYRSEAEN